MNYLAHFNGLFNYSLKQNLTYLLALGGAIYISKSTLDYFRNYFKERNENREIKSIIIMELQKMSKDMPKLEKVAQLYYKILNTVYKKDLVNFIKKRREIFNQDDIDKYILFVENYLKNLKLAEENIYKLIYDEISIYGVEEDMQTENIDLR